MLWAVLVPSLGAVLLMMTLLARHSVAKVSSLFFLTPALSTIESTVLIGERLGALSFFGLVVVILGVRITMRSDTAQSTVVAPDALTA